MSTVLSNNFDPFPIDPDFWCFRTEPTYTITEVLATILADPLVDAVHPAFLSQDGLHMFLTNRIVIGFRDTATQHQIDSLLSSYHLELLPSESWREGIYVVNLHSLVPADVITIANLIYDSEIVKYCHPGFVAEVAFDGLPNDPFFPQQWNLRNVGQTFGKPGADIKALDAWEVTTGDSAVIVAVIDDGFQYLPQWLHPDVDYSRVLPGYDFGGNHPKYAMSPDDDPSPCSLYTHGMSCAGLIIAQTNNSEGVAGVAPGVSLLPVKILGGSPGHASCAFLDPPLAHSWRIAAAVNWAFGNGAHIISGSWHYPTLDDIAQELLIAHTFGGVACFFAAGNQGRDYEHGGGISFPAFLPYVMAVGATDKWDRVWNYSNKGDSLDVVAPSGGLGGGDLWTLDGVRQTGYEPEYMQCAPETYNNYACAFGGTSGATPQVAAIAALILSVRADLRGGNEATANEIYRLIKVSADDQVGDSLDTPGWDRYYGWGRVNARAALDSALAGAPFPCLCGDADGNGLLTIGDAVFIITHIFGGGPAPNPICLGDADNNGSVTISDAVYLVNYIFAGGPAPGPNC